MTWLLYLPLTFLAHNLLHEGSHYLVARAQGYSGTTLTLVPQSTANGFRFGETDTHAQRPFTRPEAIAFYAAPVLGEAIYATGIYLLRNRLPNWLGASELTACGVDVAYWLSGLVRGPQTDASQLLKAVRR